MSASADIGPEAGAAGVVLDEAQETTKQSAANRSMIERVMGEIGAITSTVGNLDAWILLRAYGQTT